MDAQQWLHEHFAEVCPGIHSVRLQSLMDVARGLQRGRDLSLTGMGRNINNGTNIKHRIKKVDRLESNRHLHQELEQLYGGLSSYIFKYITHGSGIPIIVDVCFLKDKRDIQMLSAEVALKGRSLPLYRDIFKAGELKGRALQFLSKVKACLPGDKKVVVVMDAAFGESWLNAIESLGWHWLLRVRQGKDVQLRPLEAWKAFKECIPMIGSRAKCYNDAMMMKKHQHKCRIVTVSKSFSASRKKLRKVPRQDKAGNDYSRKSVREPWMLATNLPLEYKAVQIISFYKKRMQIEESFRDLKSHRFGLSGRYVGTICVHRWGVKLLLAAIAQVVLWVIGVIGHSQQFQRVFQANTVKNKKIFSYFYLGQLILQYDKLKDLIIDYEQLPTIIEQELAREW